MAIAFVNAASTFLSPAATSIVAPTTSLTAGNFTAVVTRLAGASNSTNSLADTAGNTYHKVQRWISADTVLETFFACNVLGHGSNVITATLSGSVGSRAILHAQFSGIALASPLDVLAYGSASGGTLTAHAFDTTVANAVIVTVSQINNTGTTWTPTAGHTHATTTESNVVTMQYRIVSALQSGLAVATTNSDTSSAKAIVVSVFNEDTAGGPGGAGAGYSRARVVNR